MGAKDKDADSSETDEGNEPSLTEDEDEDADEDAIEDDESLLDVEQFFADLNKIVTTPANRSYADLGGWDVNRYLVDREARLQADLEELLGFEPQICSSSAKTGDGIEDIHDFVRSCVESVSESA